jgi:hypothetical protein
MDGPVHGREAIEARQLELIGDEKIAKSMQVWLKLSPFEVEKKRRVA